MNLFVKRLKQIFILSAIAVFCASCSQVASLEGSDWKLENLPTDSTLIDLGFTGDPNHGWIVGSRSALLETNDGGDTWEARTLDLGDEKLTFTSVSFQDQEGWIVGKPSILLHTDDGGASWSRISLSAKLPGAPYSILALGEKSAEMVTDLGAIYQTNDGGKTWQALVKEAVGVARNINRSENGEYVAVSSRGNFYSTWKPGEEAWEPHQRNSSRRLQNMGFGQDGKIWLLARGGQVQFSEPQNFEVWDDAIYPEFSTSWGLLDLSYRTPEEIWVAGGSGNLLRSLDGGATWFKDRKVEDVPSNLYKIVFLTPEKGFVLGDDGILLKYEPSAESA